MLIYIEEVVGILIILGPKIELETRSNSSCDDCIIPPTDLLLQVISNFINLTSGVLFYQLNECHLKCRLKTALDLRKPPHMREYNTGLILRRYYGENINTRKSSQLCYASHPPKPYKPS